MEKAKEMVIRVDIADKLYRMTIPVQDEERVRRAALRIKEQIIDLRKRFDTSHLDYLAMAALQISIENEQNKERLKFSTERLIIDEITTEIDQYLDK